MTHALVGARPGDFVAEAEVVKVKVTCWGFETPYANIIS